MIDKFLFKLADWHNSILTKNGIMTSENYSDLDYIFRANMWNIIMFFTIVLAGIILNTFYEMCWLFISFNVIRDKCGGWHSHGNLTYCFITSVIIFSALSLICKFMSWLSPITFVISIFCIVYTFLKAPKFASKEEMYQYEWQFKFDYLILSVCFILIGFSANYGICVYLSIILCAIYMSEKCEKVNLKVRRIFFNE